MTKICDRCGKFFEATNPRQKYCKKKCLTGNKSSLKYSSRFGILIKDQFILRRVENHAKQFEEDIKKGG